MEIITSSSKRSLTILQADRPLLTFKHKSWFSNKGEAQYEGDTYEIKPKNIWGQAYHIYKNREEQGTFSINWKGHLKLQLLLGGQKRILLMKPKGVWKQKFELTDEQGKLVLILNPKVKLFSYNYQVEAISESYTGTELIELVLYAGYGAKLINNLQSAVAAQ